MGLFESAWRHRVALVVVVALAAIGGYLVSSRQTPSYQGSTTLLFSDGTGLFFDQSALPSQDHERYLSTQADRITSEPVTAAAARAMGDGTSNDDVAAAVSALPGTSSDTLTITATAADPERAARLAGAAATGYLEVLQSDGRASASAQAEDKQRQYDAIQREFNVQERQRPRTAGVSATMVVLQDQLRILASDLGRLQEASRGFQPAVQVLRPAKTSQVSPLPLRDAGLGGFIALLLAAAAAWGFDARWERRSDPDRFAGPLGAGCLGRVPAPAADGSAYLRLPDQWQRVVSGVDASMREVNGRCLLVAASAVTGQASRCAASLALAAAADGRSVVVVDADYASRELSHLVGAETAAGLTELTERPSGLQTPTAGVQRSEPMVALLTPGRPVSNAAAFYRTGPFRTTLAAIGQRADLVVVVGPPVLATADTSVLADAVDAVLLVVAESATEGETRAVGTALAWSSGQLIGYVVEHPAQQQAPWWRPGRTARTHPPTGLAALADLVKPLRVADEDTRANSHNGIPASALRLTSLPPRDDKRSHA